MNRKELVEKINSLDALTTEEKSALIDLLKQKKYGLVWENKPEDVEERLRAELPVLKEVKDKALLDGGEDAPNHILIEGDNLEALTALAYTHENSVDVIYIDPPYNTGNKDFVYNDSFVDSEDGYRHSKWLSFMDKRLRIAKRLLSDRGVIFISIDDNEQANLKLLCDEVFGERNFVGLMTLLSNPRGSQNSKFLSSVHEYVLMYCKSIIDLRLGGIAKEEDNISEFKEDDGDGKKYRLLGLRKRGGAWKREDRPNMFYPIYVNPKTKTCSLTQNAHFTIEVIPKRPTGELGRWTWGPDKCAKEIDTLVGKPINRAGESDAWDIFRKDYLENESGEQKTTKLKTIWIEKETNYQNARNELKDVFGNSEVFDYAKPTYIIKRLESIVWENNNMTILDFFAGSGTTLHATMQLNDEDGGHRKCILVTNNENNICEEVTYERNKRVINGYTTPKGEVVEGLHNNNLRYYQIDHVERESSLTAKRKLMAASAELLCIKHDIYEESTTFGTLKLKPHIARYFTSTSSAQAPKGDKKMLIIYMVEAIERIVEEIQTMPEDTNIMVYVFSTNNYAMDADFEDVADKVKLCALPAAIYNAYLKVLPKKGEPKQIIEEDAE